jgi:hypothetical protein
MTVSFGVVAIDSAIKKFSEGRLLVFWNSFTITAGSETNILLGVRTSRRFRRKEIKNG